MVERLRAHRRCYEQQCHGPSRYDQPEMTPEFVPEEFEQPMGCTVADLLRALPAALPGRTCGTVQLAREDGPLPPVTAHEPPVSGHRDSATVPA